MVTSAGLATSRLVGICAWRGPGKKRLQSTELGMMRELRPNSEERTDATAPDTEARATGRCSTMWNNLSCFW